MTQRTLLASWRDFLIAGVVVALFAVPATVLLVGPKPARFGFQMYSGYGTVTASWQDSTGETHQVDLSDVTANARGEIDWTIVLPRELCARFPRAVSIEVRRTQPGGAHRRSASC